MVTIYRGRLTHTCPRYLLTILGTVLIFETISRMSREINYKYVYVVGKYDNSDGKEFKAISWVAKEANHLRRTSIYYSEELCRTRI